MSFNVGDFVFHHKWQIGKVKSIDGEKIVINFQEKGSHNFSVDMAEQSLRKMPKEGFRALNYDNPNKLREMIIARDPLSIKMILLDNGGECSTSKIKDAICEEFIAVKSYKQWWTSVSKKLKGLPDIFDTSKSKEKIIKLRSESGVFADSLFEEFQKGDTINRLEIVKYFIDRREIDKNVLELLSKNIEEIVQFLNSIINNMNKEEFAAVSQAALYLTVLHNLKYIDYIPDQLIEVFRKALRTGSVPVKQKKEILKCLKSLVDKDTFLDICEISCFDVNAQLRDAALREIMKEAALDRIFKKIQASIASFQKDMQSAEDEHIFWHLIGSIAAYAINKNSTINWNLLIDPAVDMLELKIDERKDIESFFNHIAAIQNEKIVKLGIENIILNKDIKKTTKDILLSALLQKNNLSILFYLYRIFKNERNAVLASHFNKMFEVIFTVKEREKETIELLDIIQEKKRSDILVGLGELLSSGAITKNIKKYDSLMKKIINISQQFPFKTQVLIQDILRTNEEPNGIKKSFINRESIISFLIEKEHEQELYANTFKLLLNGISSDELDYIISHLPILFNFWRYDLSLEIVKKWASFKNHDELLELFDQTLRSGFRHRELIILCADQLKEHQLLEEYLDLMIGQFFSSAQKVLDTSYEESMIINLIESKYGEFLCDRISQIAVDQQDMYMTKRFNKIFESLGLNHTLINSILKKYSFITKQINETKTDLEQKITSLQEKINFLESSSYLDPIVQQRVQKALDRKVPVIEVKFRRSIENFLTTLLLPLANLMVEKEKNKSLKNDVEKMVGCLAAMAILPYGEIGHEETFDERSHSLIGKGVPGRPNTVKVVRPGFAVEQNNKKIILEKALVERIS